MRKRTAAITAITIILILGAVGAYTAIGVHYRTHFFEHTTINGIDVSDLTVQEAEGLIADQAEDYRVNVRTKDGTVELIEGEDIGYQFVSKGEVQSFLDKQNFLAWLPTAFGSKSEYVMEASVTYDEAKLVEAAKGLACMQAGEEAAPKNAYLTRDGSGKYVIVPEQEGSQLDRGKVEDLLKNAVKNGGKTADLVSADCYLKPSVHADDSGLKTEADLYNRYSSITITYQMGGGHTETLGPETIASWFSLDENKQPAFDREAVASWVNQLADQYDTIGSFLPFVTSNGETVYPESRTYGWQMDREAETEALYQQLLTGASMQRVPVWLEGAWSRGENDIGNTYVEIDYTNQRMWYYKDGALLVETAVVTGNVSAGTASPEGVFCLVGKEEDATLVGEDYKTPVDYWMPFYGGVGIHDADTWRSTYGGDIYMWSGSHGCINTPTAQAAIIYENIEIGTPIVCYSSGASYGYGQTGAGSSSGDGNINITGTDLGNIDIGGTNSGMTDNSGNSSGMIDIGGTDLGNIDIGGTDSGMADNSGNDSGMIDIGGTGSGNAGAGTSQSGSEFPITIQDEWSGSGNDETVIW